MKKEMNFWYAVSKSGRGRLYVDCPIRNEKFGVWEGRQLMYIIETLWLFQSDGFLLPDLTWSDEPKKIVLSFEY